MIKCDKGDVTIQGKVGTLLKECICIMHTIHNELDISYEGLVEMAKDAEKAFVKEE